jgi:hypothetical protein
MFLSIILSILCPLNTVINFTHDSLIELFHQSKLLADLRGKASPGCVPSNVWDRATIGYQITLNLPSGKPSL